MFSQQPQPERFLHGANGQVYFWSGAEQGFVHVFQNGTRVRAPPPPPVSPIGRGWVESAPKNVDIVHSPTFVPRRYSTATREIRPPPLALFPPQSGDVNFVDPPYLPQYLLHQASDSQDLRNPRRPSLHVRSASVPPARAQRVVSAISTIDWKIWQKGDEFVKGNTIRIVNEDPPIIFGKHLGSGKHSTVQKAEIKGVQGFLAVKIITPKHASRMFQSRFENEISNMRRVSNRHIAKFFAAYIHEQKSRPPEFGILTTPMADGGTLEGLISSCRRSSKGIKSKQEEILTKSFGCLSAALEFVHRHMIRHKDVKPANILLHEGKVLLADFGSSWDGFGIGSLTTNDPIPKEYTPRYASPEVISRDPRNAKSDVFSLGAVFYEIFCVLEKRAQWYEQDFWRISGHVRNSLRQWKESHVAEVIPLIYRALDTSPEERPKASQMIYKLPPSYFCTRCCREHRKIEKPSPVGKQVEQSMAALNTLPGQNVQFRLSARKPDVSLVPRNHSPARPSALLPSQTHAVTGLVRPMNSLGRMTGSRQAIQTQPVTRLITPMNSRGDVAECRPATPVVQLRSPKFSSYMPGITWKPGGEANGSISPRAPPSQVIPLTRCTHSGCGILVPTASMAKHINMHWDDESSDDESSNGFVATRKI